MNLLSRFLIILLSVFYSSVSFADSDTIIERQIIYLRALSDISIQAGIVDIKEKDDGLYFKAQFDDLEVDGVYELSIGEAGECNYMKRKSKEASVSENSGYQTIGAIVVDAQGLGKIEEALLEGKRLYDGDSAVGGKALFLRYEDPSLDHEHSRDLACSIIFPKTEPISVGE